MNERFTELGRRSVEPQLYHILRSASSCRLWAVVIPHPLGSTPPRPVPAQPFPYGIVMIIPEVG